MVAQTQTHLRKRPSVVPRLRPPVFGPDAHSHLKHCGVHHVCHHPHHTWQGEKRQRCTRTNLCVQFSDIPSVQATQTTTSNQLAAQHKASSPERTVHMAAKALILRAFISLLAQRQITSTHISRKPMARSPMYMNSLMTESQRTPGSGTITHSYRKYGRKFLK